MRYKIQDANKTFKTANRALCLLDAKDIFPHGGLFVYAGRFAVPFVHRGQHAGIFGPKPSLYFAEPYLPFNHIDFRVTFGHDFYGFGLDFVKIHFHKKDNNASFLYNLHNSFDSYCPFRKNGFGFGGRNSLAGIFLAV